MNNFNIKISQQSEGSSSKSYSVSGDGSEITIQRVVYNNLKSLVKNTSVTIADKGQGSAYNQFLEDMAILYRIKYENSTEEMPDGIEYLDEYLGEIGMTETYPLKKDIIHLTKFLNADYFEINPHD